MEYLLIEEDIKTYNKKIIEIGIKKRKFIEKEFKRIHKNIKKNFIKNYKQGKIKNFYIFNYNEKKWETKAIYDTKLKKCNYSELNIISKFIVENIYEIIKLREEFKKKEG